MSVNGKTGRRLVRIVESVRYLKEFTTDMDMDDYVFPAQHGTIRMMLKRAAKKAGIKKRVTAHSFRFARATYLANKGLNLWQMMKFFGWVRPETAQIYIRMSIGDLDKAILSL